MKLSHPLFLGLIQPIGYVFAHYRSHMTGYRSGAILSKNETLIAHLKKLRSPMGIGTPSFIQSAATWAWDNDDHVQKHRRHYQAKRKNPIGLP